MSKRIIKDMKEKLPSMTAGKRGKRAETCKETLERMGHNPFEHLARLACRAEINGDLATASTNWRHLSEFMDAKRKTVDPDEQKDRKNRTITLEYLQQLKADVLAAAGDVPGAVIQYHPEPAAVDVVESADDLI